MTTAPLQRTVAPEAFSSATVLRILRQLRHDRRTVGMIIGVPVMLIALLYFMFQGTTGGRSTRSH